MHLSDTCQAKFPPYDSNSIPFSMAAHNSSMAARILLPLPACITPAGPPAPLGPCPGLTQHQRPSGTGVAWLCSCHVTQFRFKGLLAYQAALLKSS